MEEVRPGENGGVQRFLRASVVIRAVLSKMRKPGVAAWVYFKLDTRTPAL